YDNGLALVDLQQPSSSKRLPLLLDSGRSTLDYTAMFLDRLGKDTLWISSGKSGLMYLAPPFDTVRHKAPVNGTTINVFTNLEAADGSIWAGTNHGLLRFDVTKTDFVTYTRSEGLAIEEFNFGAAFRSS